MTIGGGAQHIEVHLLAHTHWDREWYRPEPQFRPRLVALIDELLEQDAPESFLLDGQAVLLDDYLRVRPERASDLSQRLRDGSLEAGPWYVLPDELIPGGEALVRNLFAGRRVMRLLRATPPSVLYCPDAFGHPAALPDLAAGFGCPVIVVWRGYGGRRWPDGDTTRWRAPDGSTALLYHLPPAGYELGSHLPLGAAEARTHWQLLRRLLASRATLGAALLPLGADHHAPQPGQSAALSLVGGALDGDSLVRSSLASFGERLTQLAAGRVLAVVAGELRDSYGYAWTLAGTLGTRAQSKRWNAIAERALTRDVEPWAALARLRDGKSRRHLLADAWRTLLHSHPHDTLCGCSADEVAQAMVHRLNDAVSAGEEIRDSAIDSLLGHDPTAARDRASEWAPVVVLRNRSAHRRSGVAELEIDIVLGDVPVGPGSAAVPAVAPHAGPLSLGRPALPLQNAGTRRVFAREESPHHYPRNRLVERRRVLAWVDAVPAFGLRTLAIDHGVRRRSKTPEPVRARHQSLESARLRLTADRDGVTLVTADGVSLPDFLTFEAEGEVGDLYTHSPQSGTRTTGRLLRSRVVARGPLRAAVETLWELTLLPRRVSSAAGVSRHLPRSRLTLRAVLQIDAGAPFARVIVSGDNRATDVRVRVGFRGSIADPRVFADAAFGPVERLPLAVDDADAEMERPPATAPLHRYVTLGDATRGLTVYSDGLAEYEATADGTLYVTLLRAVGELSRNDLPERPGHAGWPVETPDAQVPGPFRAVFAVMPHGPRRSALISQIEHVADDVLVPLVGHTWRSAVSPPAFVEGVQLVGRGLACTALKESEDGEWIVLRCVNLLEDAVSGAWRIPGVREAHLSRLDETSLGALTARNGVVAFESLPRAIVTILAR